MNLYFFDRLKPIEFKGTINEDLTSSVTHGVAGGVIMTSYLNSITQRETQSNAGGLTDIYKAVGTYVKPLSNRAKATARKIGKVDVEMGVDVHGHSLRVWAAAA